MINRTVRLIAIFVISSSFVWLLAACQSDPAQVVVTRVVTSVAQEIVVEPPSVVTREVTATLKPTAVPTETPAPTATPVLPLATDPVELAGHEDVVNSIQFSPDSQLVLAASDDGTARLWDLDGNLLVTFAGHTDRVADAIFSPDGSLIVTSSDDQTARIWSVDGQLLHVLDGHSARVNSALFTPDGRFIITNAREPKIWDTEGNLLTTLEGLRATQVQSWISPNGKYLLINSGNGLVKLWELGDNGQATFLADVSDAATNGGLLYFVYFLPSNNTFNSFATLSLDLQLWGILPNGEVRQLVEPAFSSWIHDAQVLKDNIAFLVDFGFGSVAIQHSSDPDSLILFDGHTSEISTATFSDGDRYVLTGSNDHTARLWNLEGETLLVFSGYDLPVVNALISPDANAVVTADREHTLFLWDISSLP